MEKLVESSQDIQPNANHEIVGSVSVNYNNQLAGYMNSAKINLLEGTARVKATNTGSNTLKVRVMKNESSGVTPKQIIVKEWSVGAGKSFDSGFFSIAPNTYYMRVGRTSASYPTTGTGTLQSIRPL